MSALASTKTDPLMRAALAAIVLFIVVVALNVGKSLLLPLVIAGVLVYFINLLTHWFTSFSIRGFHLPNLVGMVLAIMVITFAVGFMINLILKNIANVSSAMPVYQRNLEQLITNVCIRLEIEDVPSIRQLINQINLSPVLGNLATAITNIVSRTGIILVYVFFILLEQRTLRPKIRAMITDDRRYADFSKIVAQVRSRVRTYVGIKLLTSAATGLCSYGVLRLVGVDFASFWAVLIFALNFIPTIGSIVATAFPSLLALVQFEGLGPFFATSISLTVLQVTIGGIIEPRLMGTSLNISPIIILLSLALWGMIWGVAGMFLCVPITVIMIIVFSYFPSTRPVAILLSGDGKIVSIEEPAGRSEP